MGNSLLVAAGGALGAVLRYQIGVAMKSFFPEYAGSGTLIVNVIGSLVIGYLLGITHDSQSVSESSRLFFVVGVMGGLTTFSALTHETVMLAQTHRAGVNAALAHLSANLILGLGAVWVGAWLAREMPTSR